MNRMHPGNGEVVKVYQVVRRGSKWHVHIPDSEAGVDPSEDKSSMVQWACHAAQQADGEVHVRDKGGRIEVVYVFIDGVQQQVDLQSLGTRHRPSARE